MRLTIRDFEPSDIRYLADYWYRSPAGFVESLGVDPSKMRPESELIENYEKGLEENSKLPSTRLRWLAVLWDLEPIGIHLVSEVKEGESAVFHAHFWNEKMRGKGLGRFSYVLACRELMDRFGLKEILFKTPSHNPAPNRVKERLGIPCIGEEVLDHPTMRAGLIAKVYRLDRAKLEQLVHDLKFP